jgi:hypothetical protein
LVNSTVEVPAPRFADFILALLDLVHGEPEGLLAKPVHSGHLKLSLGRVDGQMGLPRAGRKLSFDP